MADFYDPDGQPIGFAQWTAIDSTPHSILDTVGTNLVSTQYIGFSSHRPPLIYETAIIDGDGWITESHRYATRDEAVAGHQRTVEEVKAATC